MFFLPNGWQYVAETPRINTKTSWKNNCIFTLKKHFVFCNEQILLDLTDRQVKINKTYIQLEVQVYSATVVCKINTLMSQSNYFSLSIIWCKNTIKIIFGFWCLKALKIHKRSHLQWFLIVHYSRLAPTAQISVPLNAHSCLQIQVNRICACEWILKCIWPFDLIEYKIFHVLFLWHARGLSRELHDSITRNDVVVEKSEFQSLRDGFMEFTENLMKTRSRKEKAEQLTNKLKVC